MRKLFVLLCIVIVSLVFSDVQEARAVELVYKDINGNWVSLDPAANPKHDEATPHAIIYYPDTDNVAFTVTYADYGTGFGFYDATEGAKRRARVEDALTYIASVIAGENGSADLYFNASINQPANPMLASCGALFSYIPGDYHEYLNGCLYDHIKTGIDPVPGYSDAYATVNFGYTWYAEPAAPSSADRDLLSVMVHEFTHALGYTSVIASNGLSEISGTNPGVFTIFDSWLANGNGQMFCTDSGGLFGDETEFIGTPSTDLLGLNNGVRFRGTNATAAYGGSFPPIYAPSTWEDGSSITHWSYAVPSTAVMLPSYSGGNKRTYLDFEIKTLQDIGYDLGMSPSTPATGPIGLTLLLGAIGIFIGLAGRKRG
ncbi:hypothetical protein JW823_05535 [bacterium]|nr:hypothetical protein [candidate division CSSED10-310 bacterium]